MSYIFGSKQLSKYPNIIHITEHSWCYVQASDVQVWASRNQIEFEYDFGWIRTHHTTESMFFMCKVVDHGVQPYYRINFQGVQMTHTQV